MRSRVELAPDTNLAGAVSLTRPGPEMVLARRVDHVIEGASSPRHPISATKKALASATDQGLGAVPPWDSNQEPAD